MSIIKEKKDLITKVGVITSILNSNELDNNNPNLSSINTSKNISNFLLDIITTVNGSESIKNLLGELITNFLSDIEIDMKLELKKQFTNYNSSNTLPNNFINGYNVDVSSIDIKNKLKIDPSSSKGSLLYSDTNTFDSRLYDSIVADGNDIDFGNLKINYDNSTDQFKFKPINSATTINDFFSSIIDSGDFINENEVSVKIINSIFGTIDNSETKSYEQVLKELKIEKKLQKIVDNQDSLDIKPSEFTQLEITTDNIVNGVYYSDLGCGSINNKINIDQISTLINNISGSTDPLKVSNEYVNILETSISNTDNYNENKDAIEDNFFRLIINSLIIEIIKSFTLSPIIRTLLFINGSIINNDTQTQTDVSDDLENKRVLFDCISKQAKELIFQFIFEYVKKELIKLVIPVTKKILKEKNTQYINIIKSLTSNII